MQRDFVAAIAEVKARDEDNCNQVGSRERGENSQNMDVIWR